MSRAPWPVETRTIPNEQSEVVCVLSEYAAAFVTLVDLLGMQLIQKKVHIHTI